MLSREEEGVEAARNDLAANRLRYQWIGHGGFGGKEFRDIVTQRFGIEIDHFGVCFVTEDETAFRRGYNRTVSEHLKARYGKDVIAEAHAEATRRYEDQYKRWEAGRGACGEGPAPPTGAGC